MDAVKSGQLTEITDAAMKIKREQLERARVEISFPVAASERLLLQNPKLERSSGLITPLCALRGGEGGGGYYANSRGPSERN